MLSQLNYDLRKLLQIMRINIFNRPFLIIFFKNNNKLKQKPLINNFPMNQMARQTKFKSKFTQKINHKNSLPNIDSNHIIQPKLKQILSNPFQDNTTKQNDQDAKSNTNSPLKLVQLKNIPTDYQKQENEQNAIQTISIKNNSIETEKQLMTADTIRPQNQYRTIQNQSIKETFTQGLDMWSLNKNLKQFSQTRKIGFYKALNNNSKNSIGESPYSIMNKTKTQQIISMNKIYGSNNKPMANPERQKSQGQLKFKKVYDPVKKGKIKPQQREAKSFTTIIKKQILSPLGNTLYGTLPVRNKGQTLDGGSENKNLSVPKFQSGEAKQINMNPYLRTFINGSHLKRQPSNRNIQILELNSFISRETSKQSENMNSSKKKPKALNNFRKNRFEKILKDQKLQEPDIDKTFNDQYSKSLTYEPNLSPQKNHHEQLNDERAQQFQDNDMRSASSPTKAKYDLNLRAEQKKKQYQYNRSIEKINKIMLKSADGYLDYYTFTTMPNSKIQFYIDSLNHPQFSNMTTQYKSTCHGDVFEVGYDFSFKQPKQASVKTKGKRQSSLGKYKSSKPQ